MRACWNGTMDRGRKSKSKIIQAAHRSETICVNVVFFFFTQTVVLFSSLCTDITSYLHHCTVHFRLCTDTILYTLLYRHQITFPLSCGHHFARPSFYIHSIVAASLFTDTTSHLPLSTDSIAAIHKASTTAIVTINSKFSFFSW